MSRYYSYRNYYTSIKDFRQNWKDYSIKEITDMCRRQKLSRKTLVEMSDHLDWGVISEYQPLTEKLMEEFKDKINWTQLIKFNRKINLNEDFIEKMYDYIDWEALSRNRFLSREFVVKHATELNANLLFSNYRNGKIHDVKLLDVLLKSGAKNTYKWNNTFYDNVTTEFVREYKDVVNYSRFMNAFANNHKLEEYVDEFGAYFTIEDWHTVERMLYYTNYDFIVKYSEKWSYSSYTNPISYSSNKFTDDQKEMIKTLWEKGKAANN